jgi:hypothetical protein
VTVSFTEECAIPISPVTFAFVPCGKEAGEIFTSEKTIKLGLYGIVGPDGPGLLSAAAFTGFVAANPEKRHTAAAITLTADTKRLNLVLMLKTSIIKFRNNISIFF